MKNTIKDEGKSKTIKFFEKKQTKSDRAPIEW